MVNYPEVDVSLLAQVLRCEVKEVESWTSQQCVDISKHPEENYILDLKPLEKIWKKKMLDFEIKQKAIDSVKMYFNQKIRGYLINDKKEKKYLLKTSNDRVLLTLTPRNYQTIFKTKLQENVE